MLRTSHFFRFLAAAALVVAALSAHAAANRVDTIGVYRPSTGEWLLRNSNTSGGADITLVLGGQQGDLPVTGDWNGDGRTDIGIFRNGTFILGVLVSLRNCLSGTCVSTTGVVLQPSITFGQAGDLPVAGDWDGDGRDTFGVFVPGSPGTFILTDDLVKPQIVFPFTGGLPLAGNWTGGDTDLVGVFKGSFRAEMDLATVLGNSADLIFRFGGFQDRPVAGHWSQ